ncbi:hypothetical protein ACQ86N_41465 [Puia sp. P3]|uniref:hypothetical protein n=1 Tax=Puia sp. P3 TaxID=3423952 RepID=UPI003D676BBD
MNRAIRTVLPLFWVLGLVMTIPFTGMAQPNSYPFKIAQDRMLWHDKVDQEQQRLVILGGGNTTA